MVDEGSYELAIKDAAPRGRKAVPNAPVEQLREVAPQYPPPVPKYLHNTTANGATKNVHDLIFWGDGDTFKLICKASSEREGWMKSTKAMEIPRVGCFVQVTTQQRNSDGTYALAEALSFAPGIKIAEKLDGSGNVVARSLTHI